MNPSQYEQQLKAGELAEAKAGAEAALKLNPLDRRAAIVLAKLAILSGDLPRAETHLNKAMGGTPEEQAMATATRAALLLEKGKPEEAADVYLKQVLHDEFVPAESFYGMGLMLAEAEEFALAQECLEQAVELEPTVAAYHFQLARALLSQASMEEGAKHLQESLRLDPTHIPTYVVFALVLQEMRELDAAEDLLRQGLKAFPDEPHLLQSLSNVLAGKGDIPGAAGAAEALARAQPNHPAAIGNLARFRMAQGKLAEALSLCRAMAERGVATAQSRSVEAMVYQSLLPPQVDNAVTAWKEAMKLDPEDWAAANNLGNLFMRNPELPQSEQHAREALEEAHRRAPERPEPQLNLAIVCSRLGDTERARQLTRPLIDTAKELDPSLREQAKRLLEHLG